MITTDELANIAEEVAQLVPTYPPAVQSFMRNALIHERMAGNAPEGWAYRNYYALCVEHGVPTMAPLVLPEWLEPMEPQQCFRNCWGLMLEDPSLHYCEGFAATSLGLLVEHAWLEADDGTIIDPTWTNFADEKRNVATYLGVRFDRTFTIAFTTRTGWASIFNGDATLDHEILRLGLEMHDGTAIGLNKERA